ncbi:alpha/beta hydrolase [Listeria sp. PSOL-1]|uniref:alpha/beta hydrolase n=1 Tax=Listeria sp. PSOL-1 TaxID=1844999 RepID=UPI0013D748BA|nr:alpha/beta hydrolase [Listeria sp. PSOL-1]
MKKWFFTIVFLVLIITCFSMIFAVYLPVENKTPETHAKQKKPKTVSTSIPTVFVHGYAGTKNSLGNMIKRLEHSSDATKSLVLTVNTDGSIASSGKYDKFSHRPLIQVLFKDNKSSMINQTQWLKSVMAYLKADEHIKKVNVLGHSMGGVSLTNYLEQTTNDPAYPETEKLVLIAAPLNGLVIGDNGVTNYDLTKTGPKTKSERFLQFSNGKNNLSKQLQVLNIAGDTLDGTKSDGSVSLASALSGKFIYDQVKSYQQKIIQGNGAKHSSLHENTQVDELVSQFLWDK